MRRELNEGECIEIMKSADFAALSMIDAQGKPYGITVNPLYSDKRVYFHTALKGRKIDAIRINPAVSLNFVVNAEIIPERYITRYFSVIAEGNAYIVEDEKEKVRLLELLCDRFSGVCPRRQEVIRKYLPSVCLVGIEITNFSGKLNDGE